MKAAFATAYGAPEVVRIIDVPTPAPKAHELLIRVHASAVNAADWRLRRADPWFVRLVFGLFKPRRAILGVVFSGEVVGMGAAVTKYKKGDRLFGWTSVMKLGAHAEYVTVPEGGAFAPLPAGKTHTDAAAIPFGFGTALYFLRKAGPSAGQHVLVYGASGAVGSAAVQLAHTLGATVTAVCSTRNVELVRTLGAAHVLDYTKDELHGHDGRFDVVFETVGKLPLRDRIRLLKPGGALINGSEMPGQMLARAFAGKGGKQLRMIGGTAVPSPEDMQQLAALWQRNAIRPVIDQLLPLDRIAEAHARAESWRKVGSVVVTLP